MGGTPAKQEPSAVAPAKAEPRVVFGPSVEALLRAFGPPWKPGALEALRKLGLDPEKPVQAAYPLETYMQLMETLSRIEFPELDGEARYLQLGHAFIRGFERTFIGRAQLGLLRLIGPRRTLARLTRSFRTANNYSEANLRELAPNRFEVSFAFVQHVGFYQGVLEAGLREVGAKDLVVSLASRVGLSATYQMRWSG